MFYEGQTYTYFYKLDVCLSVYRCICVEKKNQLDVTECFIALIICSTYFAHFYAHHQELETICVLLPPMVPSAWLLVVGSQVQGSRLCVQEEGCCTMYKMLPNVQGTKICFWLLRIYLFPPNCTHILVNTYVSNSATCFG
jgi:hypothetical protein